MSDEPTLWELQRTFSSGMRDIQGDISALDARLDHFVLREVYDAHRQADLERMARIEAAQEAVREMGRKALWTAIGSILSPVVVAVIIAFMLRGG